MGFNPITIWHFDEGKGTTATDTMTLGPAAVAASSWTTGYMGPTLDCHSGLSLAGQAG